SLSNLGIHPCWGTLNLFCNRLILGQDGSKEILMLNRPSARLGSATLTVILIGCAVFFLAASGSKQNASRDRIMYSVDSARTAPVRETAHPMARAQFDRGRISPEQQLSSVAFSFRLSAAQQSDLQQLLREQQDRSSP